METELNFRFAVREDTPLILQMIRELADYEKLLDEVVATEPVLEEWLFDRQKAEVLFVLTPEGKEAALPCSSTTSPPSWAGPVSTWRISMSVRNTGAGAMARD